MIVTSSHDPIATASGLLFKRASKPAFSKKLEKYSMTFLFDMKCCPDNPGNQILDIVSDARYVQFLIYMESGEIITAGVIRKAVFTSDKPKKTPWKEVEGGAGSLNDSLQTGGIMTQKMPAACVPYHMYLHVFSGPVIRIDENNLWSAMGSFYKKLESFFAAKKIKIGMEFYRKDYKKNYRKTERNTEKITER